MRRNVNLEKVAFRKLEESDCNMVMIPASRHGDPDCRMALQTELEKLKQFDAYEMIVQDFQHSNILVQRTRGSSQISCKRV